MKDKLLITFSSLSTPWLNDSTTINAIAIDPDTARTAISGAVNHHYLLRYGSMFASSFLTGIASAITQSGATTQTPTAGTGTTTTTHPKLDTHQKIMVALGNVGTQYGSNFSENFNTPPTVRVASGSGIGLLIMSDLKVPKPGTD